MATSDLQVAITSHSLQSKIIHVIVSGSIGAVESVRFIRALRRLGAQVIPVLTSGGAQFVTAEALTWAAAHQTITSFEGMASHIADGDGCIVAPASCRFLAKLAQGDVDSPGLSLALSYSGQKKPVIIVPNMHDSLFNAPPVQQNLTTLAPWTHRVSARIEEGKQKFPDPQQLADETSHVINRRFERPGILVAMGTTRGYIDDVRYIANYSSGRLGTAISEELYRRGFTVHVVSGPVEHRPQSCSTLTMIETPEELQQTCQSALATSCQAVVMAASVLDFIPEEKYAGKISSKSSLHVTFKPTPKIIASLHPASGIKIGFKLESDLDDQKAEALAERYMQDYNLSLMVINRLRDVKGMNHHASIYAKTVTSHIQLQKHVTERLELASVIADHIESESRQRGHP